MTIIYVSTDSIFVYIFSILILNLYLCKVSVDSVSLALGLYLYRFSVFLHSDWLCIHFSVFQHSDRLYSCITLTALPVHMGTHLHPNLTWRAAGSV